MKYLVMAVCLAFGSMMFCVAQAAETPTKVVLVDAPDYLPAVAALYKEGDGVYLQGGQPYRVDFAGQCEVITIIGFLGTNGEANNRPQYTRKLNGSWATAKWPTVEGQFSASYNPYSVIPAGTIVNKVVHPAPYVAGNDHIYIRGWDVGIQTVLCEVAPPPVCVTE